MPAFAKTLLLLLAAGAGHAADPVKTPPKHTNALAGEKSPYLLQHAHNPVDWLPWGAAAFERAARENKPVFLSIGYSTCHWCHVMERESFENETIAKLMNEHFICIKVDREERPDIDRVYMAFVQATTGGGGWPMSVFLTPDAKPFLGGTYFPPEDKYGRPGFPTVLRRIADSWAKDRANIVAHGDEVLRALTAQAAAEPGGKAPGRDVIAAAYNQMLRTFDSEYGGFGNAPKFPRPVALNLLLRVYAREMAGAREPTRDAKIALGMALTTLRKMAAGGMHDQLGGGFHRYSVDRVWHVPHYEKMLYDQAQLACVYLDAFQITRDEEFATTARDILDYVLREMTHKDGAFFSAEDADSLPAADAHEKTEGAFYVWEKKEIEAALGEDAAKIFNHLHGVEADGNSPAGSDPHGELKNKNTLVRRMPLAELAKWAEKPEADVAKSLADSRAKLFALRAKRPRPHLDDKILTSWNGLMISALARGAQVLGEEKYRDAAQRAARFLEKNLVRDGGLLRSWREGASDIAGFADDYAFLTAGLLDLYEADFDTHWIEWAAALQAKMDALFEDKDAGGYFATSGADKSVLVRMREDYDNAEPAAASIAAANLLRLAQLTGDEKLRVRAGRVFASVSTQLAQHPSALPQMLVALDTSLAEPRQVVIAGPRDDAATRALLREVHAQFLPARLLLLADGGPGQQWLAARIPGVDAMKPIAGKPAAYVCENFACQEPVSDPAKLRELLTQ